MEKQAFFQDFQQKVMDLIKASPAADIERNIKALMGQTFNKLELVSRKPILPSKEELESNNRAHSAKLRVARKIHK